MAKIITLVVLIIVSTSLIFTDFTCAQDTKAKPRKKTQRIIIVEVHTFDTTYVYKVKRVRVRRSTVRLLTTDDERIIIRDAHVIIKE